MREFNTSVRTKQNDNKLPDIEFKLDGVKMVARAPVGGQLAYLIAAAGSGKTEADQVSAIIDFFEQVFTPGSLRHFKNRLLHKRDLEFDQAMDIFNYLIEEWSGRPTGSPDA